MGKTKVLLRKMKQIIFGSDKQVMTEPLTTTEFQSLTTHEQLDQYNQEQAILAERIEKDILDDELRRKMHQDLIDTYDEELENEIDDYVRDFRFDGREMSEQERLDRRLYFQELVRLQRELIKLQDWVVDRGERIVVIFEGRDSAGKGGAIKRITQRLNPRVCRVAALPAPTEREQSQWYFQRYVAHLPAAGEIVLFDRSWYNRAGVERVMGFCSDAQYEEFDGASGYDENGTFQQNEDYSGNDVIRTPSMTATASLSKTWNMDGGPLELAFDAYYTDEFYYEASNRDVSRQESYWLYGSRLSYLYERWDLRTTLSVRNLTDERYTAGFFASDFGTQPTLAAPRSYALQVIWNF